MPKSKELTKEELIEKYKKWEMIVDGEQPYKEILDERQKNIRLKSYLIGLVTFFVFIIINAIIFEFIAWCTLMELTIFAVCIGYFPLAIYLIVKDTTEVRNKLGKTVDLIRPLKAVIVVYIAFLIIHFKQYIETKDIYALFIFTFVLIECITIIIVDYVYKQKRKKKGEEDDED